LLPLEGTCQGGLKMFLCFLGIIADFSLKIVKISSRNLHFSLWRKYAVRRLEIYAFLSKAKTGFSLKIVKITQNVFWWWHFFLEHVWTQSDLELTPSYNKSNGLHWLSCRLNLTDGRSMLKYNKKIKTSFLNLDIWKLTPLVSIFFQLWKSGGYPAAHLSAFGAETHSLTLIEGNLMGIIFSYLLAEGEAKWTYAHPNTW